MSSSRTFLKLAFTLAVLIVAAAPRTEAAGVTVYKEGNKYVKIGGRIQLQYHLTDPDDGEKTDEVFFRRFRPYIEGSIHKDWKGKFQWDMGKAVDVDEFAVKDAYMQYMGIPNLKVTLGNANFPFSREFLTSSKKQQLVERTFVGDHNYGTPDRNVGVHVTGGFLENHITFGASAASASIDPDASKLDFDTPINRNGDFNEGWIAGGRVDWHPLGFVDFSQGDFKRDQIGVTLSAAAFTWGNDDDNNTYFDEATGTSTSSSKADVDSVTGFELSGAFRGYGISVDAEYNLFNAETVAGDFTGGLYENGETDLENGSVEGGYMILPKRLELVAGYQVQDADGYDETWNRTSVGANYFFEKHDIKVQAAYRMGENLEGVDGNDADEIFVQAQYVF